MGPRFSGKLREKRQRRESEVGNCETKISVIQITGRTCIRTVLIL